MATAETALGASAAITSTTENGRRWLMKALDPVSQRFDIAGLPSPNNDQVSTLSFTSSYEIGPPNFGAGANPTNASFDAEMYLFQNPVLFGISAVGPSGTRPATGYTDIVGTFTKASSGSGTTATHVRGIIWRFPTGVMPWNVRTYTNSQITATYTNRVDSPAPIDVNTINMANSYTGLHGGLVRDCQAYRMLWGSAQLIPTCSTMYNQGYIEATQQVFSPRVGATANDEGPICPVIWNQDQLEEENTQGFNRQRFQPNDFPTSANMLSNPKAVAVQFNQGLFVPYQLGNVTENDFQSSEAFVFPSVTEYYVVEAYRYVNSATPAAQNWAQLPLQHDDLGYFFSSSVISDTASSAETFNSQFCFTCISKEGLVFGLFTGVTWTHFSDGAVRVLNFNNLKPQRYFASNAQALPSWEMGYTANNMGSYMKTDAHPDSQVYGAYGINSWVRPWSGSSIRGDTPRLPIPYSVRDGTNFYGLMLPARPNGKERITAINMKSVSYTATVKLIFRHGFEYLVTAGSPYSVIKHIAPPMDDVALRSYIRASRKMKDAYEAYYASDEGHPDYLIYLSSLLQGSAAAEGVDLSLMNYGASSGGMRANKRSRR